MADWQVNRPLPAVEDSAYADLISGARYMQISKSPPVVFPPVPDGFHSTVAEPSASCLRELSQFIHHVQSRGVRLLILPIPEPRSIYPDALPNTDYDLDELGPPNLGIRKFFRELSEMTGIEVIDSYSTLLELRQNSPAMMPADHHWTPAAAQACAKLTSKSLSPRDSGSRWSQTERDLPSSLPEPIFWKQEDASYLRHPVLKNLLLELSNPPVEAIFLPFLNHSNRTRVVVIGDSTVSFPVYMIEGENLSAGFSSHLEFNLREDVLAISRPGDSHNVPRSEFLNLPDWDQTEYLVWMLQERAFFEDWHPVQTNEILLTPEP